MIKKTSFCNNCGRSGHLFHQCKHPIISNGIIVFRIFNGQIEILLVKRKDSLCYVDFIRGKYKLDDKDYIQNLFNKMTDKEKEMINHYNFENLWKNLWGNNVTNQYKNEEKISNEKYLHIKNNKNTININNIIDNCSDTYYEPEWGFPKGRRGFRENDIQCALREFQEETGYNKDELSLISNLLAFEEIFTGSNHRSYKNKYFLAYLPNNKDQIEIFHNNEISEIEWVNIDDVSKKFRKYNFEKIKIINEIKIILNNYNLYI
tara:strand:- start:11394 stop:12179 length:786 start_codon:yes stop_codon:yes gene_type:complete